MAEVKRKKNETFDSILGRFKRRCQDKGLTQEVRRRRYHDSGKNKNQRQESALRRETMSAKYIYMAKTGQLKDEKNSRNSHRR